MMHFHTQNDSILVPFWSKLRGGFRAFFCLEIKIIPLQLLQRFWKIQQNLCEWASEIEWAPDSFAFQMDSHNERELSSNCPNPALANPEPGYAGPAIPWSGYKPRGSLARTLHNKALHDHYLKQINKNDVSCAIACHIDISSVQSGTMKYSRSKHWFIIQLGAMLINVLWGDTRKENWG